jgi:hypothetical protein
MSSMMVELVDNLDSQDQIIDGLAYHSTLFPDPATKGMTISVRKRVQAEKLTDVSHGSTEDYLIQMLSIQRACGC